MFLWFLLGKVLIPEPKTFAKRMKFFEWSVSQFTPIIQIGMRAYDFSNENHKAIHGRMGKWMT